MSHQSLEFVVASHRLPVKVENGEFLPTDGGLSTALRSAGLENKALWVGTLGADVDDEFIKRLPEHCLNVELNTKLFSEFYNGYSNSVIWPAFHDRLDLVAFDEDYWVSYSRVNQIFAEKILTSTPAEIPVWIHDYQLMLVPYFIKQIQPQRKVSFFLHIPWPEVRVAQRIPHLAEVFYSLSRCDIIGVHTPEYAQNLNDFRDELCHELGRAVPQIKCHALPIGIKPESFQPTGGKKAFTWKNQPAQWDGINILGVDRLDYSKGLAQKIEVFGDFMELNPQWRRKVTLRQLLIPTREDVETYARYKNEVLGLVEYVNNKFGTADWQPIDLFFGRTDQDNLRQIYGNGDLCWISSYKDGMNLVALEYIASQDPKHPGLLLLSQKTGCSNYLDGPLCFDATSSISMYKALCKGLATSSIEKKHRYQRAYAWIKENSVDTWVNKNMALLKSVPSSDTRRYVERPEATAASSLY